MTITFQWSLPPTLGCNPKQPDSSTVTDCRRINSGTNTLHGAITLSGTLFQVDFTWAHPAQGDHSRLQFADHIHAAREGDYQLGADVPDFIRLPITVDESGCLGLLPKVGGRLHWKLNIVTRPIVASIREGKMKSTLKRGWKDRETVRRDGTVWPLRRQDSGKLCALSLVAVGWSECSDHVDARC